jgi:Subtilase family
MSMNMGQPKPLFWCKNQVAIRFHSAFSQFATTEQIIASVGNFQEQLNKVVLRDTPFTLQRAGSSAMPRAGAQLGMHETTNLDGVFLFPSPPPPPGTIDVGHSDAVIFYDIHSSGMASMPGMAAMQGTGGSAGMGGDSTMDHTLDLIDYLHNHPVAFQQVNSSGGDAIPNWFWTGSDETTHGCPVSPPIPVDPSTPFTPLGEWKIALQGLFDPSLQSATGKGVNVFILDTLPTVDTISTAAGNAGDKNALLRSMTNGMVGEEPYHATPPAINLNYSFNAEVPGPSQSAVTGKDVYGQLVGFPMADHGLSIAGIVRDLAPDANIECIRVLNDYGVGTLSTLMDALKSIQARMGKDGDLYQKPVVINLSLVVLPPVNCMPHGVTPDGYIMKDSLETLSTVIQNMGNQVVFVASAGNDSDPRDTQMNPSGVRYQPRYPANFANDATYNLSQVIPVGAVNQYGDASSYSNYPGPNGIATYAGETPTAIPPAPPKDTTTPVTVKMPPDALCGVYTEGSYPALWMGAMPSMPTSPGHYPMYQAPASNAWAYWTGTSFAAPIISALVARLLEAKPTSADKLRQAILSTAPQRTTWTRLESGAQANGPMIMVTQSWQPEAAAPQESKEC